MKKWLKILIVCEIIIFLYLGIGYYNYEKEWLEENKIYSDENNCVVYNVDMEIDLNISENNLTNQTIHKIPEYQ